MLRHVKNFLTGNYTSYNKECEHYNVSCLLCDSNRCDASHQEHDIEPPDSTDCWPFGLVVHIHETQLHSSQNSQRLSLCTLLVMLSLASKFIYHSVLLY